MIQCWGLYSARFSTIAYIRSPRYIDQLVSRVFSINYNKWRIVYTYQHPRKARENHFHLFD